MSEIEVTVIVQLNRRSFSTLRLCRAEIFTLEFANGRAASIILNRLTEAPERYLEMRLDGERASVHTSIGSEVRFEAGTHTREQRP